MTELPDASNPPLSPAETEILRLVWELGAGTVQQVCEKLPPDREIAYATVQTLLRRLEKKGYVSHTVQGKAVSNANGHRPGYGFRGGQSAESAKQILQPQRGCTTKPGVRGRLRGPVPPDSVGPAARTLKGFHT